MTSSPLSVRVSGDVITKAIGYRRPNPPNILGINYRTRQDADFPAKNTVRISLNYNNTRRPFTIA